MRTDRRGSAAALLLVCVTVAACRPSEHAADTKPAGGGEVVATYGGRVLTTGDLMKEFERLPGPSRLYLSSLERKQQFVENLVMTDLLFAEGKKAGYDSDAEIEKQVAELRKRLVVQRVMRQYQTAPEVTDEQIQAYYDQNPELYSTTRVRASHILVKDEATAEEVLAAVRADPGRFADLAREKSTDTASAAKGGDLGTFAQGRMVPDFERMAFKLKPGEIGDLVKTQYGYHIITVTERTEGERKPFEQVKEQIRATLRNQGLQSKVQSYMDGLKREANLKINNDVLASVTPPEPPTGSPMMPPGHPPTH